MPVDCGTVQGYLSRSSYGARKRGDRMSTRRETGALGQEV